MHPHQLGIEPRSSPAAANVVVWPSSGKVRRRAGRGLRPVEAALLRRYRSALSGRVLQLGSRGDGLTEALVYHAADFIGVGYSAPEVELCRSRHGAARFEKWNFVDLDRFDAGHFDAVVAGQAALDRLGADERIAALARIARILVDGGVLILSANNLACESNIRAPLADALVHPWRLPQLARSLRNRARLAALQERRPGYALLNDSRDGYGRLTHYVSRAHQERQLRESGLEPLECVTRSDDPVTSDWDRSPERELHFVVERRA
jgi:SAM-dependent methyltransferase